MARAPVMAAGGIVLRREQPPRIAVVRLRKRDEWVLPKGKLDEGETPREAAKREVLEETGHNVTVHEFLGTLVYDTGARAKIVHYWRMEASGAPARALMDDVRAVDWLPLDAAVERLSRDHEKTFLENVGPYALAGLIRKTKEKAAAASKPAAAVAKPAAKAAPASKPVATRKRRGRVAEEPAQPLPEFAAAPAEPPSLLAADAAFAQIAADIIEAGRSAVAEEAPMESAEATPAAPADAGAEPPETATSMLDDVDRVEAVAAEIKSMIPDVRPSSRPSNDAIDPGFPEQDRGSAGGQSDDGAGDDSDDPRDPDDPPRPTLAQKMRAWLGRAA
ncbi:NUDIX hydrolase [Bradyrhizobium sp. SZCCHNR2032]|uniref:NUDIX hydrolase n=1 Tax=Bradyrhizobium sp. SZCCHNR2032 TaxID=3057384 RepID=UPI002915F088|nr:NUDIX hydrolase [Bradyrhizobium sp. SZCCHNR2032]